MREFPNDALERHLKESNQTWHDIARQQEELRMAETLVKELEAKNAKLREVLRIIAKNGGYADALLAAEALKETT